jgi:heme/copper-type cytochrome/quinol oxidase subunit 2
MSENKNNFTKNLIEKIKTENIEPKPRWHFLLKNYAVWISGILAFLIGALATSVIIYLLKYNNWQLGGQTESFLSYFLLTLPYFWLLFLALFIYIIFYNLKHTKKGYKFKPVYIILTAVLGSILLGEIFFLAGMGKKIDDVLGSKAPFYKQMFNPQLHYFCNPEKGRLTGVLIKENEQIGLIDTSGNYWQIEFKNENNLNLDFLIGQAVNILGNVNENQDNVFEVEIIRPAHSGEEFIRRFRDRPCRHHDCPMTPDLRRFEQDWPRHYFQRFPEDPQEMGMMINIKR